MLSLLVLELPRKQVHLISKSCQASKMPAYHAVILRNCPFGCRYNHSDRLFISFINRNAMTKRFILSHVEKLYFMKIPDLKAKLNS